MAYDSTKNPYNGNAGTPSSQPRKMTPITPGVTAFTKYAKAVQVFTSDAANTSISFEDAYGQSIILASVPNGWISAVMVGKVTAVGTNGTVYALED